MAFPQFDDLRQQTKNWMENTKTNQATLSRMLKLTKSAVSEFLSGKAGLSVALYQKLPAIVSPLPEDPNKGFRLCNAQAYGNKLKVTMEFSRDNIKDLMELGLFEERQKTLKLNNKLNEMRA